MNVQLLELFLDNLILIRDKLSTIMFQIEYFNKEKMSSKEIFFEKLDAFFEDAPRGYNYAIETRNKNYPCDDFFSLLKKHSLGFVFLDGYYMPPVSWVYESFDTATPDYAVIRLHGTDRTGIETKTGKIWDKIVEEHDDGLKTVAGIVKENKMRKITTYVNVNNHYEGCAPLTIQRFLNFLK